MVETTVAHLALDGTRYEFAGPFDLGQPFTSTAEVNVGGSRHEVVSGVPGLGADLAAALGVPGFDEELRFAEGTLRIGRARRHDAGTHRREDVLLAEWQGQHRCLISHFYGVTTRAVLGVLNALRIAEHDDGVTIRPLAPASEPVGPATVTKQVPRLGLVELTLRSAPQATRLPAWRGVATPSGELFTDTLSDGGRYFVLAGEDTWATVLPLADTEIDQVPTLLGRLGMRLVRPG
ncbi:hypothetical protein ACTG9Q_12895 [Actinokineospora sp. 24-640]